MVDKQNIFVSSVLGNSQLLDGGAMFGNVPRTVWEKWVEVDSKGRIELACRALLIETAGKKILCETGIGSYMDPKMKERFGVVDNRHALRENLALRKISPDEIDFVVLSHLHFDHAGGILLSFENLKGGELCLDDLLFPKARYVVGREAYMRAQSPHPRDKASFIPGLAELLKKTGRLELIDRDRGAAPFLGQQISFLFSDGHTPGQMHTVIKGVRKN